jgi:plastocyanin domain-containing protein
MSIDKILVTFLGMGVIGFIWWFFFGKKSSFAEATEGQGEISIIVDGGYKPSTIVIKKGVETTLYITRKDQNSCLEDIVLPEFKIKEYLPLNEIVEIKVTPNKSGEFPFHCGMNMFHGKIIVK